MDEEIMVSLNDTFRAISAVIADLRKWESDKCDPRVKALLLTKLEDAQLWALRLLKDNFINPSIEDNTLPKKMPESLLAFSLCPMCRKGRVYISEQDDEVVCCAKCNYHFPRDTSLIGAPLFCAYCHKQVELREADIAREFVGICRNVECYCCDEVFSLSRLLCAEINKRV